MVDDDYSGLLESDYLEKNKSKNNIRNDELKDIKNEITNSSSFKENLKEKLKENKDFKNANDDKRNKIAKKEYNDP